MAVPDLWYEPNVFASVKYSSVPHVVIVRRFSGEVLRAIMALIDEIQTFEIRYRFGFAAVEHVHTSATRAANFVERIRVGLISFYHDLLSVLR